MMRVLNNELTSGKYQNYEKNKSVKRISACCNKHTCFNNIEFDGVKGISLYHKMGTGKTSLYISMAMDFEGEVLVSMYTSLVNNHINDITQY